MTDTAITLDEVRAATAAGATNAAQVRQSVGRGSFSTIQKHLVTLRQQKTQPQQDVLGGEAPPAPTDLVAAVWGHAWATAQARTAEALTSSMMQVRELEIALAQARADADASASLVDQLELEKEQAQQIAQAQFEELKSELNTYKANVEQREKDAEIALQAVQDHLKKECQGRELDAAKHDGAISALRLETDRLVQQLADLKSFFSSQNQKTK